MSTEATKRRIGRTTLPTGPGGLRALAARLAERLSGRLPFGSGGASDAVSVLSAIRDEGTRGRGLNP